MQFCERLQIEFEARKTKNASYSLQAFAARPVDSITMWGHGCKRRSWLPAIRKWNDMRQYR